MASLSHTMQRNAFSTTIDVALKRVNKDRERGLLQIVDLTQRFMGDNFKPESYEGARAIIRNPKHKWMKFVNHLLDELDPHVAKMTALNMGFEAGFYSTKTIRAKRVEYQCNIPWVIMIDPTSSCNQTCAGCWSLGYGEGGELSREELDKVVTQGKELGVYFYVFSGGEPLLRKADLLYLAKKHPDCAFHCFTNGALIDEAFCNELKKMGNFSFSLSLDGTEEAHDRIRGEGSFARGLQALTLAKKYGLFFGAVVCATRENVDAVTTEEFYKLLVEHGCRYCWYFHYMPVGKGAVPDLMLTPEQREYMYHRIREARQDENGQPIVPIDFHNDKEFVGGCIAGGRNYFHINANGDAEPCLFIHYSGANIRTHTLLECLQQPLFMGFRDRQPFRENMLRGCPAMDQPGLLKELVQKAGARSTDWKSPELIEELCKKYEDYEEGWSPIADRLWKEQPFRQTGYVNYKCEQHA